MPVSAIFRSHGPHGFDDLHLRDPFVILEARRMEDVRPALERIDEAARQGRWTTLALAYEAAPAFDAAMRVHAPDPDGPPLLWAAIFPGPSPRPKSHSGAYSHTPWTPLVDRDRYDAAVARIREHIRQGETYQANYTLPFACDFTGDVLAWWQDLALAQQAGYTAFLDTGRFKILSLSPELFFRRRGSRIEARPMKGTLARGRWLEEDLAHRDQLAACPKNRAENVMITDLTRNDLGRVARPGSVRVDALCAVEPYPTLWQMISRVRAELPEGACLADILAALFPCGSITGAPKIRTMGILRDLEPHARGLYCGAVGHVAPGGDCCFNVPIRTVVLDADTGRARFHVGGGITWDSSARDEYGECLVKMRFLSRPRPAFELLETLLLDRGRFAYLEAHLDRLAASARYFGFACSRDRIRSVLAALANQCGTGRHLVRLLVDERGQTHIEQRPLPREPRRTRVVDWASKPVDSSDPFLFHKTTRREIYDQALARCPDCDDVLLVNEHGQVTESCRANLVVLLDGRLWTPARRCGLLNGVFRQQLLDRGLVRERVLRKKDVERAERLWLVNSVRRWMPAILADRPSPR